MTAALFALVLSAGAAEPAAEKPKPRVTGVEIVSKGIFEVRSRGFEKQAGAAMGLIENVEEKFVSATDVIPARKRLRFGYRFKLLGKPKGAVIDAKAVTIFPGKGLRDPRNGKRVQREQVDQQYAIGQTVYHGYEFTFPWEMEPGPWIFEIWHAGKRLSRQTFTVEEPQ